jgi:hypothetical protein
MTLAFAALCACSPSADKSDPRDRKGDNQGAPIWGVVRQSDGIAAFLARPGSAPDLVLWCRNNAQMILRAHVFEKPSDPPDLRLSTTLASGLFDNVRKQGGIRDGDRTLVEGMGMLPDPKFQTLIRGVDHVEARSGTETYIATHADPNQVMPGFVTACLALPPPSH